MITSDQAADILKLASELADAAESATSAEARGSSDDWAATKIAWDAAERALHAYVNALVMPDTYDAEALRERVHEINRSSVRAPSRPTDLQPREYSDADIPMAEVPIVTRDRGIAEHYTTDQEPSESLKDGLHEPTKQDQRTPHHGGR